jgi:hypothetical protein
MDRPGGCAGQCSIVPRLPVIIRMLLNERDGRPLSEFCDLWIEKLTIR